MCCQLQMRRQELLLTKNCKINGLNKIQTLSCLFIDFNVFSSFHKGNELCFSFANINNELVPIFYLSVFL